MSKGIHQLVLLGGVVEDNIISHNMHALFDELLILVKWNDHVTFLTSVVQKDVKTLRLQEQEKNYILEQECL